MNENDSKLLSYFTDSGWFFVIDDTKKGDSFDCHADDVTVSTDQSWLYTLITKDLKTINNSQTMRINY